ncbi:hypothetical protein IMF27_17080 [Pseudomonas sp. PCH199]|nr:MULTISPECIES: hypothetical protein [unclassified Pseudomonas]MCW8277168.1 hypothetical protein [Pseudomonas sp. PCH199]PAM82721.1 hypothetical protein CES87_17425 [Pseudomonas sp. ERMR1:02]
MLPAALVVAGWLWSTASRKLALVWLGVLSVAYFVVGLSKVLFKGWGIGLESLDIAVISGHAMNACLVSTVVLSLLLRQLDHRLRWLALGAGLLSTWWFSIQYVAQSIHPLSEAIAGAVVGSAAACVFLFRLEKKQIRKIPMPVLALGLVVIVLSTSIPKYTAEGVLNSVAVTLSGAEKAFTRPHWRTSGEPSRL